MIDQVDLAQVLFLDIETVSGRPDFEQLDEEMQELWRLKSRSVLRRYDEEVTLEEASELYPERAGIFAEFGKIICISVGIVYRDKEEEQLRVRLKSFASENEAELLHAFSQLIFQHYNNPTRNFFCGHNIKEFDIPYICRRLVANQLPFPGTLQIHGKKPWELQHFLDTMELWKFGDYKSYTSLRLLASVLDFPSPKSDIDGSEVGRVYWEDKDLERIAHYCEKDVLATIQLLLRYKRMPLLEEEQVSHLGMG